MTTKPLCVHVLIDLEWTPAAGGHVKCWERLAEAAENRPDLDFTLHVAGAATRREERAPNVRFCVHRPVFSTRAIPFLGHVPDHTDMAGYHPGLAAALTAAAPDVIHTTDAFFNYARTAEKVAARLGVPIVHSVHTDTVAYTELFTRSMLEKKLGGFGRWLNGAFRIPERAAEDMRRKLRHHQRCAVAVLTSRAEDYDFAAAHVPHARAYRLGLDFSLFAPARADRSALAARYGIPPEALLLAFAGRLDEGKNIYLLLEAVRRAAAAGQKLFLLAAGIGPAADMIAAEMGGLAATTGFLAPPDLAQLYASADWLALPSQVETWSMAAAEALACGLPVIAAAESGVGRFIREQQAGLLVEAGTADAWVHALGVAGRMKNDVTLRGRAAQAARTHFPGWRQALEDDFLPVWRQAAALSQKSEAA